MAKLSSFIISFKNSFSGFRNPDSALHLLFWQQADRWGRGKKSNLLMDDSRSKKKPEEYKNRVFLDLFKIWTNPDFYRCHIVEFVQTPKNR